MSELRLWGKVRAEGSRCGEGKSGCGTVRKKGTSGRCVPIRAKPGPLEAPCEPKLAKTLQSEGHSV